MGIEYFLQQLVNGICLGGMYALMSVGYSLVYSIMNFSNFAHGGVIMVGAYVGYFALTSLNVPFFPAFLLCGLGSGVLAVIIERLVYSPLRKRRAPSLYFIISAMGEWRLVMYGLAVIIIMIVRPKGLMGGKEFPIGRICRAISRIFTGKKKDLPPPDGGDGGGEEALV